MINGSLHEYAGSAYFVRVYADQVPMANVDGWVGAWAIYKLPRCPGDKPVRFGDTGFVASQSVALNMARAVACIVAASLKKVRPRLVGDHALSGLGGGAQ